MKNEIEKVVNRIPKRINLILALENRSSYGATYFILIKFHVILKREDIF